MKHSPLQHLAARLDELRARSLLRVRQEAFGGISLSSNDYLGLSRLAVCDVRGGAGASRMTAGEDPEHGSLERALADWLGAESALLFSSGYAANVGVLSALLETGDLVVSDALNHASIIDGIRLGRAELVIVPHLDVGAVSDALERPRSGRAWVVTESYFSMDADSPDLARLRRTCDEHGAGLIVDEAHALGVFGAEGRGLCAAGATPDVLVGTLGKSFGAAGAFVAGSRLLADWLWNRARSHVFSTGMSPAVAATAQRNLATSRANPTLRERAITNGERFRRALKRLGQDVRGYGPIVPWVLGSEVAALDVAHRFHAEGLHVSAIRPPTVPAGTSRVRFSFTANHTEGDVERAVQIAERIVSRETSNSRPVVES